MKKLLILIIIVNFTLSFAQLVLANYRAGDGDQVSRYESKIRSLSQSSSFIEAEIYSAGSLSVIEKSAQENNFVPLAIVKFGSPDLAVVQAPSLP